MLDKPAVSFVELIHEPEAGGSYKGGLISEKQSNILLQYYFTNLTPRLDWREQWNSEAMELGKIWVGRKFWGPFATLDLLQNLQTDENWSTISCGVHAASEDDWDHVQVSAVEVLLVQARNASKVVLLGADRLFTRRQVVGHVVPHCVPLLTHILEPRPPVEQILLARPLTVKSSLELLLWQGISYFILLRRTPKRFQRNPKGLPPMNTNVGIDFDDHFVRCTSTLKVQKYKNNM